MISMEVTVSTPFFVVLTFACAWRFLLSLYFWKTRKITITISVTDNIINRRVSYSQVPGDDFSDDTK
jgi:hypothetical protein